MISRFYAKQHECNFWRCRKCRYWHQHWRCAKNCAIDQLFVIWRSITPPWIKQSITKKKHYIYYLPVSIKPNMTKEEEFLRSVVVKVEPRKNSQEPSCGNFLWGRGRRTTQSILLECRNSFASLMTSSQRNTGKLVLCSLFPSFARPLDSVWFL